MRPNIESKQPSHPTSGSWPRPWRSWRGRALPGGVASPRRCPLAAATFPAAHAGYTKSCQQVPVLCSVLKAFLGAPPGVHHDDTDPLYHFGHRNKEARQDRSAPLFKDNPTLATRGSENVWKHPADAEQRSDMSEIGHVQMLNQGDSGKGIRLCSNYCQHWNSKHIQIPNSAKCLNSLPGDVPNMFYD